MTVQDTAQPKEETTTSMLKAVLMAVNYFQEKGKQFDIPIETGLKYFMTVTMKRR